jgi:quinol monooxygenase YgiN
MATASKAERHREDTMRSWWGALLGGALLFSGAMQPAGAQTMSGATIYTITYFDIVPADFGKAVAPIRDYAAAARKADGNSEVTVLDEIGRGGRMAIIEAWRDKAALEAHGNAVKALADKLLPFFAAPFDSRQFVPLSIAPPAADEAKLGTAMYVLTHVDVFPSGKDDVAALVRGLVDDSRKDKGAQRFDALTWDGRPNHFHLIEAWNEHLAREAHAYAEHTRTFRAKLVPFEGALYDERLYEVVR